MCGIAGFVGFRDDKLIKQVSEWIKHRGPDGDGYYIDEQVTLLNRRLAIIDVKGGQQPIYNEDKTVVVVFNGEIYNYMELRAELEKQGHLFSTKSDTEVIVHGYEEWGTGCFDKLNGMFGIALYDKKQGKTILVRDHFGIKPVYFAYADEQKTKFMFASEIKPLIYSGLVPVEPNDRIIYRYLKYRIHDDGRETFFKGVERLLPGEMMLIMDSQKSESHKVESRIKKYTDLESELIKKVETIHELSLQQKQINDFKSLLTDSIKRRLVSEVSVGSCLSGGLDSSTVVAVINKLLSEKAKETQSVGAVQRTFSAVFPGSTNDEEKYIDEIVLKSESHKVESHKVYPNPDGFFKDLKDFVKTQEEPTISTGPYAQYKVMEEVHKHVTVVLDGQGADEMMAGYNPYYFVYLRQLRKEKKYGVLLKELFSSTDIFFKLFSQKISQKKPVAVSSLLNKEFKVKYKSECFITENENIKKRLLEDIFKNSLQSLLRYEDKNAMRFSIEGRVPFLDFRLLRFLFGLPDGAIIDKGWNKNILRKATEDILPQMINKRRNKIGFTTPEHEWFMKNGETILSYFTGQTFLSKKYVNQAETVMAFKDFLAGKNNDTMVFWRILNLELWMREFVSQKSKVESLKSEEKKIEPKIAVEGEIYTRYPIKTDVFKKGDDIPKKIALIVKKAVLQYSNILKQGKFFVVVSEKVVATAQGRAYFIWDIHPGFFARLLSRFVSRVPWGIGLGSPWTMQLAIREVGLPRILVASLLGGLGKLVGMRGVFYKIAGRSAAGIDGPTEYSLYPANVSAKLLPKDPKKVCENIDRAIKSESLKVENHLHSPVANPQSLSNYLGSAIIDANDIGQNILGNTTGISDKIVENVFKDNPMGQTNEQTPVTIVIKSL